MNVKIESVSAVQKKLSISIPEQDVLSEIEHAYQRVGKSVKIPGFRSGKVPRAILEKRYGPSIEAEVYQELVQKTVVAALEEHKLDAIRVSEITEPKREKGEGFSYVASVEVKPEFEPKDYLGVKIDGAKIELKKEQVDATFKQLQDAQAVLKHREGATSPLKGDFVAIITQETDDAGNLKPTKEEPKEQLVEIGNETLQPEVEKAIMNMKVGESGPVALQFKNPDREIHARITLNAIKEKILPALDDEFAKSVGPFQSLAALREQIEKDLNEELAQKAKVENASKIIAAITKKNPIDLPESLVHEELHGMIDGLKQRMQQAGVKEMPPEYTDDKLHQEMRPDAQRHVHEQLLIEAIAEKENIDVQDQELDEKLKIIATTARVPMGELRAYYEKTGRIDSLRFQMLSQKTLDFLLSKAMIKS